MSSSRRREHLEHAAHEHGVAHTRAATLIGIMAAGLALTEFAAKDAQTSYLTNHIATSDTWAQYQSKSVRRTVLSSGAGILQSLPNTTEEPVVKASVLVSPEGSVNQERLFSVCRHNETRCRRPGENISK